MKKAILLGILCLMATAAMAQDINKIVIPKKATPTQKESNKPAKPKIEKEYVDLGLPSGTKWGKNNLLGYYLSDEANAKYSNQLPTSKQWEELIDYCQWTWVGNGFKVQGPNGNSIILPSTSYQEADGTMGHDKTRGYYHSSDVGYLVFEKEGPFLSESYDLGFTIRPVQNIDAQYAYIDLGLPSGTKWKKNNVAGFYSYEEAVSKYANQLPSKKQWEELMEHCDWKWTGNGYKVVGPNGNSILLPAAGYQNCKGDIRKMGSYCDYWSSTPDDAELAWYLYSTSTNILMDNDDKCLGLSVRLVKE